MLNDVFVGVNFKAFIKMDPRERNTLINTFPVGQHFYDDNNLLVTVVGYVGDRINVQYAHDLSTRLIEQGLLKPVPPPPPQPRHGWQWLRQRGGSRMKSKSQSKSKSKSKSKRKITRRRKHQR